MAPSSPSKGTNQPTSSRITKPKNDSKFKMKKHTKTKSPGVRIIHGRIYDSENGKTCHQCGQKTMTFSVTCKNYNEDKQCGTHFCQICVLNRKKRGSKPTGKLSPKVKANGFSSVSHMLHLEDCRSIKAEEDTISNVSTGRIPDNTENNEESNKEYGALKDTVDCDEQKVYKRIKGIPRKNKGSSSKMSTVKIADNSDNNQESTKEYGPLKDTIDCDEKKVCKRTRRKSPGVRIKNGKVYDSENGKCCHQCRQKTTIFSVRCKNNKGNEQCALYFCHICLLNRYGENAEEMAKVDCPWKCPKCRGVCNCSFCMKRKGSKPTGRLHHIAKAKGFNSVSEMLVSDIKRLDDSSPNGNSASNEDLKAASSKKGRKKTNLNGNHEAGYQSKPSKRRKNDKEEVRKSIFVGSDEMRVKVETMEESGADERVKSTQLHVTDNISTELVVAAKNDKQELSQELLTRPTIKNEAVEDVPMGAENTTEFEINKEEIAPPLGNQLTKIANLELPVEDIGNALQFLEFCHTFGQVLGLRKEQPESLLQELVSGQMSGGRCDFSSDYFHIKLLSIIQRDSGRGCSLEAAGRDSWIEAFGNYISDSEIMSKELMLDSERWGLDSYEKQSPSKKLRILTFLCDEALGTSELRNWIDQQNMKFVEEAKKIKIAKKKLQDEMAAEILQTTGKQLLMSEHDGLSLKMKAEVIQCLNNKLDEMKKGMRHAVRSDPLLSDKYGRMFWNLRSYSGEINVLLQDVVTDEGSGSCNEKWFFYNVQEKASVDKYIAGYHCRTADKSSSLLFPVGEN